MGPQIPVPVSEEEAEAVVVVSVVSPERSMRAMLLVLSIRGLGRERGKEGGDSKLTSMNLGRWRLRRLGYTVQVSIEDDIYLVVEGTHPEVARKVHVAFEVNV